MGATNRPYDVDNAILRRMPARFYVPLPDTNSRAEILRVLLRDEPKSSKIDFERVAGRAGGMSGSDLKEVCRLAMLRGVKSAIAGGYSLYNEAARQIEEEDLINSIAKYRESTSSMKAPLFINEALD
ncbi:unnamed protein product [Anisakis simplex]|uniref:Mitochondrial sorting homolog (inferred by orthology to a C. elegans protein) n=1 Tax=Anisakis simplex TaxID=6269 RepID=A0A0M3KEB9_ANISI|nr:unnamed protein product [Anisakis simplex]